MIFLELLSQIDVQTAVSSNRAEQIGYYRSLENENVTVSELMQSIAEHCQQNLAERHVLAKA